MAFDNLENVLNKYAKAYTQKFKAKLKSDRTNASGRLVNSIKPEMLENGFAILGKRYIEQISEGRKKGKMPPWSPRDNSILNWVKTKNIVPRNGSSSLGNMKRLAFVIARSIGRRGTIARFGYRGTNIIDFVHKELGEQMGQEIFEAYKIDLEKILNKQIKKT
jgi:hypothetical protein